MMGKSPCAGVAVMLLATFLMSLARADGDGNVMHYSDANGNVRRYTDDANENKNKTATNNNELTRVIFNRHGTIVGPNADNYTEYQRDILKSIFSLFSLLIKPNNFNGTTAHKNINVNVSNDTNDNDVIIGNNLISSKASYHIINATRNINNPISYVWNITTPTHHNQSSVINNSTDYSHHILVQPSSDLTAKLLNNLKVNKKLYTSHESSCCYTIVYVINSVYILYIKTS